ncbi:DGQHR domain-containing protein [Phormidium sp. CCY1219]|uniref:DGQHR domain-containing protein n=1 Tax=Phormidium sp. CCY1219 TaxID=2886104 RepID=UPI002D1F7A29|nr:DGQHR domain-containing protein [Phormidium sp. CCY1219]MEB3827552.1 DGQHR domain-containing protein [Phormidium sp. CCY1219]
MKREPKANSDIANKILERENRDREALALLLDRHLARSDRLLVQKTQMGNTEAYMGSVSLEWLDSRVRFASQLPLFCNKFDSKTDNVVRDRETIDEILQRPLDWSRQASLTLYLVARPTHKFPAVLVVQSPAWVDDPNASEWDENGRARQGASDFIALDKDNSIGVLEVSEKVSIYALDGQHRLMGVQGLMNLIKTGRLQRYNKTKKPVGAPITLDDLNAEYQINAAELQNLAYEKIGIEFIPAVLEGETREEARRRIRSIFVHVNLMAANLSKGQLALLNEDNGFSIIARQVAVNHPLFRDKKNRKPRVNWDSATVAAKSTVLTTLQALADMCDRYLIHKFPHWKPRKNKKGLIPLRPEDEELEEGLEAVRELFDYLASLLSYQKLESEAETPEMRRFSHEKNGGEGNLLFRPVGQIAFAQAMGILVFEKGFSLKKIFKKLQRFDVDGGFSGMEYPQSLWYGVLYDPNRKRVLVSGRDLAAKLLVYLLGGIKDDLERAELRKALADARTIEEKAVGFDGKFVSPKQVGLPPIL